MMSKKWTDHLKTDEEKKRFSALVKDAAPVLKRLQVLQEKELQGIEKKIDSEEFLILPGTKDRLVANLARRKELKRLINFIEV